MNAINANQNSLKIVKDPKDHTQEELLSFFKIEKPQMIINQNIVKPLFFVLSLLPVSKSNIVRDMFTKLFYSAGYTN